METARIEGQVSIFIDFGKRLWMLQVSRLPCCYVVMVVATSAEGKASGDVSGRKNVFQTNLKWERELEVAGDGGGDAVYAMGKIMSSGSVDGWTHAVWLHPALTRSSHFPGMKIKPKSCTKHWVCFSLGGLELKSPQKEPIKGNGHHGVIRGSTQRMHIKTKLWVSEGFAHGFLCQREIGKL